MFLEMVALGIILHRYSKSEGLEVFNTPTSCVTLPALIITTAYLIAEPALNDPPDSNPKPQNEQVTNNPHPQGDSSTIKMMLGMLETSETKRAAEAIETRHLVKEEGVAEKNTSRVRINEKKFQPHIPHLVQQWVPWQFPQTP